MDPITFNNSMVAVVGAYAAALQEERQRAEQLQVALKQKVVQKPSVASLVSAARRVVDRATENAPETGPLTDALYALATALKEFE